MSDSFQDNEGVPWLPHDHVIFTDLGGNEGVLVDLNAKQYYQLNATASLIWQRLARGVPVAAIATELADAYDVTVDHARASVEVAVDKFVANRLLKSDQPQGH